MSDGVITVNNPAIWRPVLDIRDAVSATGRSGLERHVQCCEREFHRQVADLVKDEFEERLGRPPGHPQRG